MTSRDDFIAELIAALKENDALVGTAQATAANEQQQSSSADDDEEAQFFSLASANANAANTTEANTNGNETAIAHAAYASLQFDFPLLGDSHVSALAEMYRAVAEQRVVALAVAQRIPITKALLHGLDYLNDSMNKRRGSEASGLLAAALLLLVPRFCVEHPASAVSAALLQELRVEEEEEAVTAANGYQQQQQQRQQQLLAMAQSQLQRTEEDQEGFSSGFVEIYAAEEDPDDLSLVYEDASGNGNGNEGALHTSVAAPTQPLAPLPLPLLPPPLPRHAPLCFLASKTYATCFSQISSAKWRDWQLDAMLCDLIHKLLSGGGTNSDSPKDDEAVFVGVNGEWQRYLFILRDQLLRFGSDSDVCTSGTRQLQMLIEKWHDNSSAMARGRRVVFRVLAELAVSKEFNATSARRSQHALATTIQQLFPVILHELHRLSSSTATSSSSNISGVHASEDQEDATDFVLVLLQLVHFVVASSSSSDATGHRVVIDKLHDSGLLRAWLAFLPPLSSSSVVDTVNSQWQQPACSPWLAPLLRLFGESALWNQEFAVYLHRVPKVVQLLQTITSSESSEQARLPCESLLLAIAAYQHQLPQQQHKPSSSTSHQQLWARLASDQIIPATCSSFLEAMHKMADALFLFDALCKAMATLRGPVALELRTALQSMYSFKFPTAFQYPTFEAADSTKDEPEPSPSPRSLKDQEDEEEEEGEQEEEEERGRAEALQFVAMRNRLRQSIKSILLFRSGGGQSGASSKLD